MEEEIIIIEEEEEEIVVVENDIEYIGSGGGTSVEEIYIGSEKPTDENIKVWINPDGDVKEYATEEYVDNEIDKINYFADVNVDEPDITIETTEETSYIFIDKINDKAFSFNEMWVAITIPATTTTASRVCISDIENKNRGLNIGSGNTSTSAAWSGVVHIHKVLGKFVIDSVGTNVISWLGDMAQIYRDYHLIGGVSSREKVSFAGETITSFNLMLEQVNTQPLPVGTTLKIWGRSAE